MFLPYNVVPLVWSHRVDPARNIAVLRGFWRHLEALNRVILRCFGGGFSRVLSRNLILAPIGFGAKMTTIHVCFSCVRHCFLSGSSSFGSTIAGHPRGALFGMRIITPPPVRSSVGHGASIMRGLNPTWSFSGFCSLVDICVFPFRTAPERSLKLFRRRQVCGTAPPRCQATSGRRKA